MKNVWLKVCLATVVVTLFACGNKKKSEDIIAQRVVKVEPKAPVKMQKNTDGLDVQWIGKTYHVSVHRQPADSLPMVKDETGQEYVDNIFTLAVSRQDGSVFFSRKFTKSDFANYVPEDFRRTGILEGLVFDKADGDWLVFAASVGRPQTDEYIPLVVKLSRMGTLEVRQDTELDTTPQESQESEEEDI